MGLSPLRALLKRHRRIALDTSVFIYHLEENPAYVDLTSDVFTWLQHSAHAAVTSSITMTELLVHPYRAGNEQLVNRYFALLSTFPRLEWMAPDLAIADGAARLRARYNLRTPDAIQAATALASGATAMLTNDAAFSRVPGIEAVVLRQFAAH